FRSSLPRLLHRRNTRYGWVASPYPTGTLTLQDAPSFSQRDNVDAVCISVVAPSTVIHARYFCTKLRAQSRDLKIAVGLWGATENIAGAAQRLRESGADEVVTTLADAVVQLAKLAPPADLQKCPPRPSPDDEKQRLAALTALNLLNTNPEPVFDRVTKNRVHFRRADLSRHARGLRAPLFQAPSLFPLRGPSR
ncbi:MAG: hypothetical protein ACREYE_18840, partial [Gammaproteobacteria bacterium]